MFGRCFDDTNILRCYFFMDLGKFVLVFVEDSFGVLARVGVRSALITFFLVA